MQDNKTKVLYIAGWGRSGSTILERILGQVSGFFTGGELCSIWERGLVANRLCGCGVPFRECEVWGAILERAFGEVEQVDAREMYRLRMDNFRTHYIPLMLMPGGKSLLASRLKGYLSNLEKLYQAIQLSTGSRVIVDSSKIAPYGYVLGMIPAIDLYVVHIVRDPRAVAFSWLRKKLYQPETERKVYLPQYSSRVTSFRWNVHNLAAEVFWGRSPDRYLMVRYEDFINKPQETVRRIFDLVEEKASSLPFVDERKVELHVNHTVSGNPARFQNGIVELKSDQEWRVKMNFRDRLLTTLLTWPLLIRYKYPVGPVLPSPE